MGLGQFARNSGYIAPEVQKKIEEITLLIAGCGVGSQFAIAAARMGVQNFVLVDADHVEITNLNRQAFQYKDIGKLKVEALAAGIMAVNPEARVEVHGNFLNEQNVQGLVAGCDYVFDTIDFLDLKAILDLHECANKMNKTILSAFSAGWGACLVCVRPNPSSPSLMRTVFGLGQYNQDVSYTECFKNFFGKIINHLPAPVQKDMQQVILKMADSKPCPASHVIAGSLAVASMGTTALYNLLNDDDLNSRQEMILVDFESILRGKGIALKG